MKCKKTIYGYSPEEILFVIHNYGRLTHAQVAEVIGDVTGKDIRNLVDHLRKQGFIKPVEFYGLAAWRKQAAEKREQRQFEKRVKRIKRLASSIA